MKELYDKDMREALFSYFEDSMQKVRFIEEINMGKSRADAIMISENEIVGFELKSDRDSFARLAGQIKDYDRYYDKNYLVIGKHFVDKAEDKVPDYWGIIEVCEEENNKIEAHILKAADRVPEDNLRRQLGFLWRNELINIVRRHKLGGVSDKNKVKLANMLYKGIDRDILKKEMLNEIFEREYPKIFYYIYDTPIQKITFVTNGYTISRIYLREIKQKEENKELINNMALHREIKRQFDEYFAGKRKQFELPLEKVRCSAFSKKVYEELKKIPYGTTKTYGEIAVAAGKAKAYRAVGNANNKNPFPIIVPCHRVIGADGSLTGYAGGKEFKEMLISIEKRSSQKNVYR